MAGMVLGLAAALVAATCYGVASVLQAMATAGTEGEAGIDVVLLVRLVGRWRYVAGLGLDALGFLAAIVALQRLPLFVVESATAGSVGVTALGAHRFLGVRLGRGEHRALAALAVGLVVLGVAGRPGHARHLGEPGPLLLVGVALVLGVVAVLVARSPRWAGLGLAAVSGASFAAVAIASRAFEVPHPLTGVLGDPLAYAIVLNGGSGILLYASALQRGSVTTVAAVSLAVQTVLPTAIGLAFLGDHARTGFLPVAVVGFLLTLGAALELARHAAPVGQ